MSNIAGDASTRMQIAEFKGPMTGRYFSYGFTHSDDYTWSYAVQFDTAGGPNVPIEVVHSGDPAPAPVTPVRAGYVFDGWYTAPNGGNLFDFNQSITQNTTVYAHWHSDDSPRLERLSGAVRYDTMGAIVSAAFPSSSEYVVVASGEGYADALSASSLAGGLKAPIVLTQQALLSDQAREQIQRVGASKAIVIGSTVSVSEQAVSELRSMGLSVDRVQGTNRYETNVAVYKAGKRLGVNWSKKMIVASGDGYADALSISSYAYKHVAPIFLASRSSGLSYSAITAGGGNFRTALVVGSVNVVPGKVDSVQLPYQFGAQSERVAGATRYETSAKVAEWCVKQGMGMDGAVFASGEGFADALAAGPLAGRSNAALMLVRDPSSPAIALAGQHADGVSKAWVVGSSVVVDNHTMQTIADTLGLKREN
ncbi:repeat protein [Bifidobacterium parmae]|uniref:Repeat protein n=2 Tax=Bifidobacterium parmae TaxID=361854 RepID=A0A2N5J0Q1_9BIFI|nr:repeat protein [Bifidobacterium parmae]